jgi:hypothetical protein
MLKNYRLYLLIALLIVGGLALVSPTKAFASTNLGGKPPTTDPNQPTFDGYMFSDDDPAHATTQRFWYTFLTSSAQTIADLSCDMSTAGSFPTYSGCTWVSIAAQGYIGRMTDTTNIQGHGADKVYPVIRDPDGASVDGYRDCDTSGVCVNHDGSPGTGAYVIGYLYGFQSGYLSGGTIPTGPRICDRSCILDMTPTDGTTTPNTVYLAAKFYVSPDDVGSVVKMNLSLRNIDQNVLLLGGSGISPGDIQIYFGLATTTGNFWVGTTTTLGDGNYRLEADMTTCVSVGGICTVGTSWIGGISETKSTQFIVNQETFIGHISQQSYKQLNSIFASSTATSTAALAGSCNPLSGMFSMTNCGAFLFIPDAGALNDVMTSFRDGFLTRMPWGYFTRVYSILTASSTQALPTLTYEFDPAGPYAGKSISFDFGDMMTGGAAVLAAVQDPVNHRTIRDVLEPVVKLLVALAVIFGIIHDLTGSHSHVAEANDNRRNR